MQKIAMAGLLCSALLLPGQVMAQQATPVATLMDEIKSIDPTHAAVIALGAVGGAVIVHWAIGGSIATVVGAGAGALVGDWYYFEKVKGTTIANANKTRVLVREAANGVGQGFTQISEVVSRQIDAIR